MAGTGYNAWLTVSAAEILISIFASAGFLKAHFDNLLTESGMVAEKNKVCLDLGVF